MMRIVSPMRTVKPMAFKQLPVKVLGSLDTFSPEEVDFKLTNSID